MTKSKDSQIEKEAKAELRKIKRRVRNITKRGYSVPENLIPNMPKKVTDATIRHFKKYTTDYIYRHSVFVNPEGVTIKGTERRRQERSEAAKKGAETRRNEYFSTSATQPSWTPLDESANIIYNLIEEFESWTSADYWSVGLTEFKTRDKNRGYGIIQGAINEIGELAVAENAKRNANRINELVMKILYESGNEYREDSTRGEINNSLNELNELLRGNSLSVQESQKLTEQAELLERHELI